MSGESVLCLLTDHLQGVHVYISSHHPALGVELGPSEADRHADLSVPVAAYGQTALTLQTAGRPAAGGNTTVSAPETLLNNEQALSRKQKWLAARTRQE